jgi:ABC-type nitrate/sulfonate/bicarbonate transport system permease component
MKSRLLGLIVPLVLLASWEIGSRVGSINPLFFPPPSRIATVALERLSDGTLFTELFATMYRLLLGFFIGALVGYVAGVLMAMNTLLRQLFEPLLSALYTIPKIVLLPIFLLLLGFGDPPKIALIALTVFFYVWVNTLGSARNIPSEYFAIAKTMTKRQWSIVRHVVLPASLPSVFTGLRIGIAVATLITISAEFIVGDSGLGYLIFNSRRLLKFEDAYVGIVVVGLLGFLLQNIVKLIGRRVTPWALVSDSKVGGVTG